MCGKTEKNILKNQSKDIFPRHKIHRLLQALCRKKLVRDEDFEEEKKIAEEQQQKAMEEKKAKKGNVDVKLLEKTRNLNK